MFGFEKLEVWQESINLADAIYRVTKSFPDEERFGLISQLRRAMVSISSNIAEGSSRTSRVDFARFVEIAYGSLMEVVSQLHVAQRQGFVYDGEFQGLYVQAEQLARMLSGLKASLAR